MMLAMKADLLQLYKPMLAILFLLCLSVKASLSEPAEGLSVGFSEIKEYANYSSLVYRTEKAIKDSGLLNARNLTRYQNIPEIEVSFFLLTDDQAKTHVVAVRGTSNIENAFIDIDLKLAMNKHAGIKLHNGFSQAAQGVYNNVLPYLKPGYTVNTTGHSLGGAVALILAMYLDVDGIKLGKVITFGQPKVTNISGANSFKNLQVIRVVTEKDVIPLVPPLDAMDLSDIDIYWHQGKEVLLLPGNNYSVLQGLSSMMRATKFTQRAIDEANISNHQMMTYLSFIENKIPSAELVPFKNSFNLFNLFGDEN